MTCNERRGVSRGRGFDTQKDEELVVIWIEVLLFKYSPAGFMESLSLLMFNL